MRKTEREKSKMQPQGMQKLMLICICLLLCTSIYIFINLDDQKEAAAVPPAASFSPVSDESAPPPGIRPAVFLERLQDEGLNVSQQEGGESLYRIETDQNEPPVSLQLSMQSGYVRGFVLRVFGAEKPETPKNPSQLDRRAKERYQNSIRIQDAQIHALLPPLISAVTPEGYFSNAAALAWTELCKQAREKGAASRETKSGYHFIASMEDDGTLYIAADAV